MQVSGLLRWGRAAVLAAVAMTAGLVAHETAGGLLPGPAWLLALFLCCWLTAARLLGRPASTPRVVVLLVLGQLFIHASLTALVGHRGDPPLQRATPQPPPAHPTLGSLPTDASGRRVGSLLDQMQALQPGSRQPVQVTIPAPIQHLVVDFTGPHAAMALAHVVATAAVGWWLARGELVLWTVLALTVSRLLDLSAVVRLLVSGRLLASTTAPTHRSVEASGPAGVDRQGVLARACLSWRGPPQPA